MCVSLTAGNLVGEVVLWWRWLAGGTGEDPCATPPARGKVQLPFEKGFVWVSILALAVSCYVELPAGEYSASFCASGRHGSVKQEKPFSKVDEETDFKKQSRHFSLKSVLPDYLAVSRPFTCSFLLAWVGIYITLLHCPVDISQMRPHSEVVSSCATAAEAVKASQTVVAAALLFLPAVYCISVQQLSFSGDKVGSPAFQSSAFSHQVQCSHLACVVCKAMVAFYV